MIMIELSVNDVTVDWKNSIPEQDNTNLLSHSNVDTHQEESTLVGFSQSRHQQKLHNAKIMPIPLRNGPFSPVPENTSQSRTGPQSLTLIRPRKNISTFDFKIISVHRPACQKWSKLTALPNIQIGPSHVMPECEYRLHCGQSDESSNNYQILSQNLADTASHTNTDSVVSSDVYESSTSITRSGPVYSIQNIALRNDSSFTREQKLPIRRSKKLNSQFSTGTGSDFRDSESSDPEAYEGYNRHRLEVKRHENEEDYSTVVMDGSLLDAQNSSDEKSSTLGIGKCLPDLRNAVLINNWIKILENTKETDLYSELTSGTEAGHYVYPANFKQALLQNVQEKVSSIDLAKFYNQPKSFLREYDHMKHLNQFNSTHCNSYRSQISSDGANVSTEPSHAKEVTEGRVHRQILGEESAQKHHIKSPRKPKHGLADLLAVQAIATKEMPSIEIESRETKKRFDENKLSKPITNILGFSSPKPYKRRLEIKVDITPKGITDSVNVNAISSPMPNENVSKDSVLTKHNATTNSSEQHLQELLLHVAAPVPRPVRVKGHKKKEGKIQNARHSHYPLQFRREAPTNLHPDLVIVGSSALDINELRWREKVKALIRLVAKSKGNQN